MTAALEVIQGVPGLTKNVVCMKWGDKYDPEYVNKLFRMVGRHCSYGVRFIALTDDPEGIEDPIETFEIPNLPDALERRVSPWRKLALYSPELSFIEGPVLFLDLDVVIVGNIDDLFDLEGEFLIIENWTQKGRGIGNSSVIRFDRSKYEYIYETALTRGESILREFGNEQIFISHMVKERKYWPPAWCRSFKEELRPAFPMNFFSPPRLPADAKVVVFHGYPNPPEALKSGPLNPKKFFRPATWINDHWR